MSDVARISIVAVILLVAGCQKSSQRVDARGDGQGGVEAQQIASDSATTMPTASAESATTEPVAATQPVDPASIQAQAAELEARVRQLEVENKQLRQQPTASTAPTTSP